MYACLRLARLQLLVHLWMQGQRMQLQEVKIAGGVSCSIAQLCAYAFRISTISNGIFFDLTATCAQWTLSGGNYKHP
ncbi:hypothetical protein C8J55DRAFT_309115 [Lentinula edodes]|uniref:Secreted protein n=1 Tax=Lentinula lateritia TaxID=40482 RepID=A0A9W8ZR51_9AGAR|nr:hypothetical protein C8J55DRAFT_309115 [Lentinula edodes]